MVIYVYKRQNSGTEPMHCKKGIRDRTKSSNKRVEDGTKSNTKKDKRWNQKGRRWNQGDAKAGDIPLTLLLAPRSLRGSGGTVEEGNWQGGGPLVGKGVRKLETVVGWGRGGTLAVRRVLRGGAGRG